MKAWQNAMTQKGVHFVPWFARRNRRERNWPAMNAKQIAQGEGELVSDGGEEWKSCIFAG